MSAIYKSPGESQLIEACNAKIHTMGFRIVDLDLRTGGQSLVRIFIDKLTRQPVTAEKAETISIENCTEVSRALGELLDTQSCIPGPYELEVSSPGLDRRLREKQDFEEALNSTVKLKLLEKVEGLGANYTGKILRVEEEAIVVDHMKKEFTLPFSLIKQANLVWSF